MSSDHRHFYRSSDHSYDRSSNQPYDRSRRKGLDSYDPRRHYS